MTELTVFTIADEAFLPGVAGLINSLRALGFDGSIVVGTPAPIPALDAARGVRTVRLDEERLWRGFHKPALLQQEAAGDFVFFDADIVVEGSGFLERLTALLATGPVLSLEGLVAPTDARRVRWATRLGTSPARSDAWSTYNAGFLACRMPRDAPFLEQWHERSTRALRGVRGFHIDPDFPMGDQDVLNAQMQTWTGPTVSLQFPDWWSAIAKVNPFFNVGALQYTAFFHCTGSKPWNLTSVPPRAPTLYERHWYRHTVLAPISVRTPVRLPWLVDRWLAGSWPGQLAGRALKVAKTLYRSY